MAIISPFKGILYNTAHVKPKDVIIQPYDKISPEAQASYYEKSPYNIVRIIKGKAGPDDSETNNVYTRAACFFQQWLETGVLVKQEKPAYYYLEQTYRLEGVERTRKGLVCMGRVEDYDAEVVFPHEQTLKGPKKDRLELFRATNAAFGQVFLLYNDKNQVIDGLMTSAKKSPQVEFCDDEGVEHKLYVIDDTHTIESVTGAMKDKKLFIADGHHRYETALAYKKEMNEKYVDADENSAYNYCMMTLVNMDDEGMTVLPTHRLVKNVPFFDSSRLIEELKRVFTVEEMICDMDDIDGALSLCLMKLQEASSPTFIAFFSDSKRLFMLKAKSIEDLDSLKNHSSIAKGLDIVILHDAILEPFLGIDKKALAEQRNLDYRRNARSCLEMTLKGDCQALFLLNPTKVEQVRDMALNRETMPQKSTDFYPKILTGFVVCDLSEKETLRAYSLEQSGVKG
ncbi:MAG: DUF1015 domain-containing protein [Proteobacteria bacterium]|nr:DUF1015 domain-containing protein [Pseudomonadota bacterium]